MTTFAAIRQNMDLAEFRQFFSYLFTPAGATATTGVIQGLTVTQTTTASGTVNVAAGAGIVQDAIVSGVTPLLSNSTVPLDVFTSNPMSGVSNPRNDIVVFNTLTMPASIQVVTGTPNAAPTDPTVAATSLKLARLRHAANATTIPTAKIDSLIVPTGLQAYAADTGWKNITVTDSGWSAWDAVPWQARKIGTGSFAVVYFRGSLKKTTYTGTGQVGTLPAGISAPPVHAVGLTSTTATSPRSSFVVDMSGAVLLYAFTASSTGYTINGSYPLG